MSDRITYEIIKDYGMHKKGKVTSHKTIKAILEKAGVVKGTKKPKK